MIDIVLTVHNKDFLIDEVIKNILNNSSLAVTNFILIFDGCTDNSESVARATLVDCKIPYEILITDCIYETRANNLGMQHAKGDYVILTQDDDLIHELYFDQKLLAPFLKYPDEFLAVGARNAVNASSGGAIWYFDITGRERGVLPEGTVTIRDIVNRGPLMLDLKKTKTLGYFDEDFAPLGQDDSDLCIRGYKEYGWLSGAVPMQVSNSMDHGGTRCSKSTHIYKDKNGVARLVNMAEADDTNWKRILGKHGDYLSKPKHNEVRNV